MSAPVAGLVIDKDQAGPAGLQPPATGSGRGDISPWANRIETYRVRWVEFGQNRRSCWSDPYFCAFDLSEHNSNVYFLKIKDFSCVEMDLK